jgi:hypothetical protein
MSRRCRSLDLAYWHKNFASAASHIIYVWGPWTSEDDRAWVAVGQPCTEGFFKSKKIPSTQLAPPMTILLAAKEWSNPSYNLFMRIVNPPGMEIRSWAARLVITCRIYTFCIFKLQSNPNVWEKSWHISPLFYPSGTFLDKEYDDWSPLELPETVK